MAVDAALRQVIAHADYDLHKSIERDEETEQDNYGEYVDLFIAEYDKARSAPACIQVEEREDHEPHQFADLEEGVWHDCPGMRKADEADGSRCKTD